MDLSCQYCTVMRAPRWPSLDLSRSRPPTTHHGPAARVRHLERPRPYCPAHPRQRQEKRHSQHGVVLELGLAKRGGVLRDQEELGAAGAKLLQGLLVAKSVLSGSALVSQHICWRFCRAPRQPSILFLRLDCNAGTSPACASLRRPSVESGTASAKTSSISPLCVHKVPLCSRPPPRNS